MSIRYTLRLAENGAEVWKRWTGDREEALRDLVTTVTDLDVDPQRAENFALAAQGIDPGDLLPGQMHSATVMTKDLDLTLGFEVYRTKG
jgi:hypothetical protein